MEIGLIVTVPKPPKENVLNTLKAKGDNVPFSDVNNLGGESPRQTKNKHLKCFLYPKPKKLRICIKCVNEVVAPDFRITLSIITIVITYQ